MTKDVQLADGADVDTVTFLKFLETFAGGELAAELTKCLGRACNATVNHDGKSSFSLSIDVETVDESLFGTIVISHKIKETPARVDRAGVYRVDPESGVLQL